MYSLFQYDNMSETWILRVKTLIFKYWWVIPMLLRVHGFEHGYRKHGFEGTGYLMSSTGYIVRGYRVRSFLLPCRWEKAI